MTHYFVSKFGTEGFQVELEKCRTGALLPKVRSDMRMKPGSISALIALYYSTPDFTGLKERTRHVYRGELERFRLAHGDKSVANLKRTHLRAILGGMASTPSAANNLLDRLRSLMRMAVDEEWRAVDPTMGLRGFKVRTLGFHSWTEEEIGRYEARHPLGTKARLALDLLLYTVQRRSDAIVMGRQHRSGNSIRVVQEKTGTVLELELHPELLRSLKAADAAAITGDLTYLVSNFGKPFTSAGFGNKMRQWCDEAGLPQCSAHGLRKAGLRRMAEHGSSNPLMKSVSGHQGDKEVAVYTAAANQKKLAQKAMHGLSRPKPERKLG